MAALEDSTPAAGTRPLVGLVLTPEQLWLLQRQVRDGRGLWQGQGRARVADFFRVLEERVERFRWQYPAGLPLSGASWLVDQQRFHELKPRELKILVEWAERQRRLNVQVESLREFWRMVSIHLRTHSSPVGAMRREARARA